MKKKNVIISFHSISNNVDFSKLMKKINEYAEPIDITELKVMIEHKKKNVGKCHITFDDGDITFYNNALPVMKKLNIPFSLFISPKVVVEEKNYWFQDLYQIEKKIGKNRLNELIYNQTNGNIDLKNLRISKILSIIRNIKEIESIEKVPFQNLNIDQLIYINSLELSNIGPHTLNHPILANESSITSNYEITESVNKLSSILGKNIDTFAYPNGLIKYDFSEREINILRKNKIKLAFTTMPGFFGIGTNPLMIPRIGLSIKMHKIPFSTKIKMNEIFLWKDFYLYFAQKGRKYSL